MDNPTVWIAIASLFVLVVINIVGVAFFFGRLFERLRNQAERIDSLEADSKDGDGHQSALAIQVAGLTVEVGHLSSGIQELKGELKERFRIAGQS